MEKKKYETPVTEIVNIGAESVNQRRSGRRRCPRGFLRRRGGGLDQRLQLRVLMICIWRNVWTLLSGHYATRQKGKITETFTHLYIYTL